MFQGHLGSHRTVHCVLELEGMEWRVTVGNRGIPPLGL